MARVLLVCVNSFMDTLIPVGISLLSACLKEEGHETKLFDTTFYRTRERPGNDVRIETLQVKATNFGDYGIKEKKTNMVEDFKKMIEEFKPDLIAFSMLDATVFIGKKLLNSIKDYNIPKLVGGFYPTMSPEEAIKQDGVDIICIGEGEKAIVELANRIEKNQDYSNIPNLWIKKEGEIIKNPLGPLINLDELPMQDWSIYEKERFYRPMGGKIWIMGTCEFNRGCPHRCAFCCNAKLQDMYKERGHYPRQRKIENYIKELKELKEKYNLEYVFVVAENFLLMNDERFNKFIELYKDIRLPFWVETRPETIDIERLKKLKDVGCEGLTIGVEHGNEEFRRKVLNRFVSNDSIIKAVETAGKAGIRLCVNNIIGFPTETRELIFDTIKLNRKFKVDSIVTNIFSPYRGSELNKLSIRKGYIAKNYLAGDYRTEAGLDMPQLSKKEIKGLQRTFPLYVAFPKERWDEVKKAESDDQVFKRLSEEYRKNFLEKPVTQKEEVCH